MRGHLEKLNEQLDAHPLKKKRDAKKEDVGIAKGQLEILARDLEKAKAALQDALRKKDDIVSGLQRELGDRQEARSAPTADATARGRTRSTRSPRQG